MHFFYIQKINSRSRLVWDPSVRQATSSSITSKSTHPTGRANAAASKACAFVCRASVQYIIYGDKALAEVVQLRLKAGAAQAILEIFDAFPPISMKNGTSNNSYY
jgi:hypothetical protein